MENPSIALIPSAYKASKLYSVLPTNGDGDFTFTRASVATRINEAGLIEEVASNIPRLDYLGDTCPVLILEPQTTNILQRNEEFNSGTWNKTRASIADDDIISPDGSLSADKLIEDNTASSTHDISKSVGSAGNWSYSVFAKQGERNWIILRINGQNASFDLSTGIIGTVGGGITAKIISFGDGWYRCIVYETIAGGTFIGIRLASANNTDSYSGDGVSGLYVWGAQMEKLPYETSYIKTTASTVTRLADQCKDSGTLSDFNDSEGVLYCYISALFNTLISRTISISDGTANNRVTIGYDTTSNNINAKVYFGGILRADLSHSVSDITILTKCAIKYKINDCALWVDGVEVATDISAAMPIGLNELSFDDGVSVSPFYGKCKDLRVYKTALTDLELQTLTT